MSESMQVLSSAGAAVSQSKVSSSGSGDNTGSTEDFTGFTAVLATYVETETDSTEQQADENLTTLLNQLMPQDEQLDGNLLPADEQTAIWQALMMAQPSENAKINSAQLQSINLLDGQRKSAFSPETLNQNYFNMMALQNKDNGGGLPASFAQNNISMQLAAAQFSPEVKDALLLNMNEQLMSVQGNNTMLSQSMAAVGLGTATQAAATQTQLAPLNLGQSAWESNLGSRLQMLVGQNIQTAEIRLDPPELGALDIKIKVINEVANVTLSSPNAQVREAMEASIPRLREMFAESGVSLGDVNVGQESFAQQQSSEDEGIGAVAGVNESDFVDEQPVVVTKEIMSDRLLDFYA